MKTAFSLFEMIIVIVLIAIVVSMSAYKLFFTLDETNILQIKTQVHLIRNAITQKQNESILLAQNGIIEKLDDASFNVSSEALFTKVLNQNIFSTSENEAAVAKWIKLSQNQYKIYLSKDESLTFYYDQTHATFECDYNETNCKELFE